MNSHATPQYRWPSHRSRSLFGRSNWREVRDTDTTVKINIDSDSLDITIEKANRLVELLREVQQIVGCLSGQEELKS